jgi:uncharacterized protein
VADLQRVLPELLSDTGELLVELDLGKAPDGTRFLSGSIQGDIELTCQRCMEGMKLPLDLAFCLGLVQSQEAANDLPDCYEPLVLTAEPASIADIVSDEVLLALPIVPLHSRSIECQKFVNNYKPSISEQRENPFAVLAGLKQKQ